jgi:hypothetical protein
MAPKQFPGDTMNLKVFESNHLDKYLHRKVILILVYWTKLVKYRIC